MVLRSSLGLKNLCCLRAPLLQVFSGGREFSLFNTMLEAFLDLFLEKDFRLSTGSTEQ